MAAPVVAAAGMPHRGGSGQKVEQDTTSRPDLLHVPTAHASAAAAAAGDSDDEIARAEDEMTRLAHEISLVDQ